MLSVLLLAVYMQVVVWVDPLDGTGEFTKGELKVPCEVHDYHVHVWLVFE